jgi:hypothetical protein
VTCGDRRFTLQAHVLAVGSFAVFSVYLLQPGSPESKPVGARTVPPPTSADLRDCAPLLIGLRRRPQLAGHATGLEECSIVRTARRVRRG